MLYHQRGDDEEDIQKLQSCVLQVGMSIIKRGQTRYSRRVIRKFRASLSVSWHPISLSPAGVCALSQQLSNYAITTCIMAE